MIKVRICFECMKYITIGSDFNSTLKLELFNDDHMNHLLTTVEVFGLNRVKNFECEDEYYNRKSQKKMMMEAI